MIHLTPCEQKTLDRLTLEWQTKNQLNCEWKYLQSLVKKGVIEECTKRSKEKHPYRVMVEGVDDIRNYMILKHYRRKVA